VANRQIGIGTMKYPPGIRPHHTQFTQATMEAVPALRCLRNNHWNKPPIEDAPHIALHNFIATVPLLDQYSAQRVHRDFVVVEGDYIATLYSLIRTIDQSLRHHRTTELERNVGSLTMQALEMQVPFIKEGLYNGG
jgi:hypothetical protein